jgi:hypothetical protein
MSKQLAFCAMFLAVLAVGSVAHAADMSLPKSDGVLTQWPLKIVVPPYHPPVNRDECKNDKWMRFENPVFVNREACIKYVETPNLAKARYIFLNSR